MKEDVISYRLETSCTKSRSLSITSFSTLSATRGKFLYNTVMSNCHPAESELRHTKYIRVDPLRGHPPFILVNDGSTFIFGENCRILDVSLPGLLQNIGLVGSKTTVRSRYSSLALFIRQLCSIEIHDIIDF